MISHSIFICTSFSIYYACGAFLCILVPRLLLILQNIFAILCICNMFNFATSVVSVELQYTISVITLGCKKLIIIV